VRPKPRTGGIRRAWIGPDPGGGHPTPLEPSRMRVVEDGGVPGDSPRTPGSQPTWTGASARKSAPPPWARQDAGAASGGPRCDSPVAWGGRVLAVQEGATRAPQGALPHGRWSAGTPRRAFGP